MAITLPKPLFDTFENIFSIPESITTYLKSLNIPAIEHEFTLCLEFLKSYGNSADTFTAYRREVERLLQWAWLICKKPLKIISRNDIREYLLFINSPPTSWIGTKTVSRFILNEVGLREANPVW